MTTRKRPESPLRKALAARTSLRTHHDLAQVDTETATDAQRRLDGARQLEVATLLHEDPAIRERAAAAVAEAVVARDACFHRIWCRGLTYDEFDALVALNPPTAAEAKDGKAWSADFEYALLAECVEGSDLSAEEWETEISDWAAPDRARLISAAFDAQRQSLADAVPKD